MNATIVAFKNSCRRLHKELPLPEKLKKDFTEKMIFYLRTEVRKEFAKWRRADGILVEGEKHRWSLDLTVH